MNVKLGNLMSSVLNLVSYVYNFAENRKFNPVLFRRESKQNWFRAQKSIILYHK